MSELHRRVLEVQDIVFTAVFLVDVLFKLLALGPTFYFSKKWNQVLMQLACASL